MRLFCIKCRKAMLETVKRNQEKIEKYLGKVLHIILVLGLFGLVMVAVVKFSQSATEGDNLKESNLKDSNPQTELDRTACQDMRHLYDSLKIQHDNLVLGDPQRTAFREAMDNLNELIIARC